MHARPLLLWLLYFIPAFAQSGSPPDRPHQMEILLERMDGSDWTTVDPRLVFAQNDRVRFRFKANFSGYLYVMDRSTSGKYEQLFPREETGQDNNIVAGKDYVIPATQTLFRIGGPPGQEVIYWLVSPVELGEGGGRKYKPLPSPPPPDQRVPDNMVPRCDDSIFRARGQCVDSTAGPQRVAPGEKLPRNLAGKAQSRDLSFMRNQDKSVVASPAPLTGPVIYEFRLAHK